jgi:hypothetical protein
LIFYVWGGNFEFLRGLDHVGLFYGNGVMAETVESLKSKVEKLQKEVAKLKSSFKKKK